MEKKNRTERGESNPLPAADATLIWGPHTLRRIFGAWSALGIFEFKAIVAQF
jgi:hypothetical protein